VRVILPATKNSKSKSKGKPNAIYTLFSRGKVIPIVGILLVAGSFLLKMYPDAVPDVSMPSFKFDLFSRWSEEEYEEVESLNSSIEMYFIANDINQADVTTAEDWETINAMLQAALTEAESVSDGILEKVHPEMTTHFNDEYKPGLVTGIWALGNRPPGKRKGAGDTTYISYNDSLSYSRDLLGKWVIWYYDNLESIQEALELD